jgi:hypothetical protein
MFENDSSSMEKGDFIIVLDLDMTLVYSSPFKPEPTDTGYITVKVSNLVMFRTYELNSIKSKIINLNQF